MRTSSTLLRPDLLRQFAAGLGLALAACGGGAGVPDAAVEDSGSMVDAAAPDSGTSPRDITNAVFTERSGDCADYAFSAIASVRDIQRDLGFEGRVDVLAGDSSCELISNAIPNHDFNDASAAFATPTAELEKSFTLIRNPAMASSNTALSLGSFDAVMLNGVVVDMLAAGCFGVGDGRIGCGDLSTPWRYDPMSPSAGFGTDAHHAHTQPDGRYHYHGDPLAMYGSASDVSPVVGFAADGFPIYGPYFDDGTEVRAAVSGYSLRSGSRPTDAASPGGSYDGTYVDDYEFTDAGDLDECNGMTVDGQYGYYITGSYPWILRCFHGTVDASFSKRSM